MALTTAFDGTALPAGWSVYNPAALAGGSVTVSGGRARIVKPAVVSDSIFSTGSVDQTYGIQHAVTPSGNGSIDIAFRLDGTDSGDHGDVLSMSLNLMVVGATTASMIRLSMYQGGADSEKLLWFGYARAAGAGANVGQNNTYDAYFGGQPAFGRVVYDGATGVWTWLASSDGIVWKSGQFLDGTGAITTTRAFTPVTVAVGVSGPAAATRAVRIAECFDMTALGFAFGATTADLRKALPERQTVVRSSFDGTAGSYPAGWSTTTTGTGFADTFTGTALELVTPAGNADATAGLLRSGFRWGTAYNEFDLYAAFTVPTVSSNCYLFPAATATPAVPVNAPNGLDQYNPGGGGYGLEVQIGGTEFRRPIRIDDDSDRTSSATAPFPTGLDETPYCHQKTWTLAAPPAGGSVPASGTGTHHVRLQRIASRFRAKEWVGLKSAEPATWDYFDGDDTINDGPLFPALSLSYNGTAGGVSKVAVSRVEVAELVPVVVATGAGVAASTGAAAVRVVASAGADTTATTTGTAQAFLVLAATASGSVTITATGDGRVVLTATGDSTASTTGRGAADSVPLTFAVNVTGPYRRGMTATGPGRRAVLTIGPRRTVEA